MDYVKDTIGEILIYCSSLIYDLTSGLLSGEEDAPLCMSNEKLENEK